VIAYAAVSGPVPKLGVVVVALCAAGAMLLRDRRQRALAMLGALVLAPVLLLADIWHSKQLHIVHHHPLEAVALAVIGLAVVGAVAWQIRRRMWLLGPLAVLTLPFRIPISTGDTTNNLLVPLYLVVAAGSLAVLVPALLGRDHDAASPRERDGLPFEWLLAGYVVLYAVQATYSVDFEKALQNMVFFYVPFALLYRLLRDLTWDRELVVRCLQLLFVLAVLFACIGFVEYATKSLLLNSKLIAQNEVHTYFTVNSVFYDPDIFGRFLALVMILLASLLLYARDQRIQVSSTVVLAILWGGLLFTLSRSSLAALLVGLAILAALRWQAWPVLALVGTVVVIGGIALAVSPKTFGLNQGLNGASSGRANLVSGGLDMFGDRPVWGYGSGAFVSEYQKQHPRL
jgi:putative inorganic carbon (hco3(-)) transporter